MPRPLVTALCLALFAFFSALCGVCVYALSLPGAAPGDVFASFGAAVLGGAALLCLIPIATE